MASIAANLASSARRFPEKTAISHGQEQITYRSLWRRASGVAAFLKANGIGAGDRVAMAMENCIDAVAIYYGTLLSGAILVPLNAAAKARDFDVWLRHCAARVIFHDSSQSVWADIVTGPEVLRVHVGPNAASTAALVYTQATVEPVDDEESVPETDGNAPAMIIYTSGTTGSPKGVLLSHGNLVANTAAIVQYLRLTANDSIVSVLPLYYSYGSSVLHTHIKAGAEIVFESNLVYPHAIVASIAARRVTGFSGVPSTYALLLSRVTLTEHDLSSLRYLTQAGGAMSAALTQRLRASIPQAELFVMYGQTEATARLTYLPPDRLDQKLGSVGIPIQGIVVEVRDETGQRCAPNTPGEVFARGPSVMLGYWQNETATRETLQGGWLKTGDLGYLDDDGYLFLAGRRSDMIKAGAHRVHPQDVEEVIQELDDVAEVAVVGVDDELLGQVIKACIVPRPGRDLNVMDVKAHCRARLANYKVPKYIEILTSLPKTASGKVRRHELRRSC